jgi:5-(carboxyamino)imidazole ribonucleotide synthase
MFTAEARRMGYRVIVVDPLADAPAGQLADRQIVRPWTDVEAITELAENCRAVTTEFENVPADVLRALAAHLPVRPRAEAVAPTQDRIDEKSFLNAAGIVTVPWAAARTADEASDGWDRLGGHVAILKTARMGYDGKGQAVVERREQLADAWRAFGARSCILERRVTLARELSVMVARGTDGSTVTWPVGENVHRHGILHTTTVPAMVTDTIVGEARRIARQIVTALDYVGVMGVEFFLTVDGALLVNELAPRPHNSGHWTLDASATSQFEQQVRTLAELPLGDTRLLEPVAMVNLLGELWSNGPPPWDRALAIPGVRLHLYGKKEPRSGRKMGHLTAVADDAPTALAHVLGAWEALGGRE